MILRKLFAHAVAGFRNKYPRSKYEFGGLISVGLLVALLFENTIVIRYFGIAWTIIWGGLYLGALSVALKKEGRKGDLDYDRKGKFELSREYRTTESATSAKARKKKNG